MSDNTKIEWADATLNYANGCSVLTPGCTNCYAMKQAHRFPVRQGLTVKTKGGMVWTGEVRINAKALDQALAWKRGRRIFWNAHGDMFHEKVTDAEIDRLFAVCALTPQHTHMILTKRSARMREYFAQYDAAHDHNRADFVADAIAMQLGRAGARGAARTAGTDFHWPLTNVWLGVSVEDQVRADERIPDLLATPAAVRFLSCEPLLGPVDLRYLQPGDPPTEINALAGTHGVLRPHGGNCAKIDWVIAGGEGGPGARPMHPDWARSLRDQCAVAGVPFHFKQWGEYHPADQIKSTEQISAMGNMGTALRSGAAHSFDDQWTWKIGKKCAGRLLDGVTHDGLPA